MFEIILRMAFFQKAKQPPDKAGGCFVAIFNQ